MAASPEALMLETAMPSTRRSGISGYRCLGLGLAGTHVPVAGHTATCWNWRTWTFDLATARQGHASRRPAS